MIHCIFACTVPTVALTTVATAQWVDFAEEPSRLSAPPALVAADPDEKDYAWGDLDNDGDVDLVIVRKQPFTTTGRRANVLLMNESGVLTDRTTEFASASDVAGDQGFLTPTNDRDVVLTDVDGDGWLDAVTAVTLTDNDAKHLSHPRVYMNLGEEAGVWLGLRYEDARIPTMHPTAGPRFCAVSAGDVTGDGAPDLFFSDYDDGPTPQIFDYNDRLLVNNGQGVFIDVTTQRLSPEMYTSFFGISNAIADVNGDGLNDIIRLTANSVPYHVGVSYNSQFNVGFFNQYDMVYSLSGYHVDAGDLNGDGLLDLVVIDDGNDRYLLNQGNNAQGEAQFLQLPFPPQTNVINAGNVVIADLDLDGWNDVIIADVDVDIVGCNHRTFIFHNQGNAPQVSFVEEDQVIPDAMLMGVYDVAAMDIDGDGRLDLVIGRCSGTEVWMNLPPATLAYTYPQGVPDLLTPDATTVIQVTVDGVGSGSPVPDSGQQYVSVNGGAFAAAPMIDLGGGTYEATLPALSCPATVRFYFSVDMSVDSVVTTIVDPPGAPAVANIAFAAASAPIVLDDTLEGDVSAWSVTSAPSLTAGAWEIATPNPTTVGPDFAAPPEDATTGAGNSRAFVTDNGPPGGSELANDVDGGPTWLASPLFDLDGADAVISYARWFFTDLGVPDTLAAEITNTGGAPWTPVTGHVTAGTGGAWEYASFIVSDHVPPTATVRVRFVTSDQPNDSVTEAGIDDFRVQRLVCAACPGDLDTDGSVGFSDLLQLIGAWGPCSACAGDLNGDGSIGFADVLLLIGVWGAC